VRHWQRQQSFSAVTPIKDAPGSYKKVSYPRCPLKHNLILGKRRIARAKSRVKVEIAGAEGVTAFVQVHLPEFCGQWALTISVGASNFWVYFTGQGMTCLWPGAQA
jgi:hypothetical protein